MPQNFQIVGLSGRDTELGWDPSPDADFRYYTLYRSLQDGFVRTSAGRVAREREVPLGVDEQLRDIGATLACKRAVKAGMPLSMEEIRSLLDRAGSAVDPRHCPHGRPTVVSCSRAEVEKMFDRR